MYRSSSSSGTYSKVGDATTTSYTDTGLTANTTYYYKVSASNSAGESSQSSSVSAKTSESIPAVPSEVSASAESSSSIKVSWSSVTGATGYKVYRSSSSSGTYNSVGDVTTTSYTNTGLTAGTTYYYKVSAYNSAGESAQSSSVSAKPESIPATPTGVSASAESSTSIKVSWSSVIGATGYKVYRSTSSSGTYSSVGDVTTTSYTNTGLTAGTTYYYKVSAYNSAGESAQSSSVSAKPESIPSTPTGVWAEVASSSSIQVGWSSVTGATGYKVYRSTSSSGTYSKVGDATTTSYTDTGLTANTTYYYKVSATNSAGESAQSSSVSAKPESIPSTPTGVWAGVASENSIWVGWSSVTGATGYVVYRSSSASGTYRDVGDVTTNSYTDTGLTANTTYYYKVSAYNSTGEESAQSSSVSATTIPSAPIPATPTGLTATQTATNKNKISWSAVTWATEYKVYCTGLKEGPSSYYYCLGTTSSTSFTDILEVILGETIYYKVSACNSTGESGLSEYVSVTSILLKPETPRIELGSVGSNYITIHFSKEWAEGCYVYRSSSASGTYIRLENPEIIKYYLAWSFSDSNLSPNTTYYYKIITYNSAGESDPGYISATTTK